MVTGAHKVLRRQDIMFEDKDQALRDDVRTLGTMVGDLIREQGGEPVSASVLQAHLLAPAWQVPLLHLSPWVQALPSSQAVPS